MPFFGQPKVSEQQKLADLARVLVRAGMLPPDAVVREVAEAARDDARADRPDQVAAMLVEGARTDLLAEQAEWPDVTDYDRLQAAFVTLRERGIVVLEPVDDHWQVNDRLTAADDAGERLDGVVWFTAPDVWHAVEHGMLEINVWHGDSANIAAGDALLDDVVGALAAEGLDAHFDEGRVEVTARWHRRLGQ